MTSSCPILISFRKPCLVPVQTCFCTPPKSSPAACAFRRAAPKDQLFSLKKRHIYWVGFVPVFGSLLPPKKEPRMTQHVAKTLPKHTLKTCIEKDETLSRYLSKIDLTKSSKISFSSRRRACFHFFMCLPICGSRRLGKRQNPPPNAPHNGPGWSHKCMQKADDF